MRRLLCAAAALAAVFIAAPAPAHAADASVRVGPALSFTPPQVTINVGNKVTWTWDGNNHTVTFPNGPDSGVRNLGATFQHTFNAPGTFNYVCTIHQGSGMTGSVVVQGSPTPTPTRSTAAPSPTRTTARPTPSPSPSRTVAPSPTVSPTSASPAASSASPSASPSRSASPTAASASPSASASASPSAEPLTLDDVEGSGPDRTGLALVLGGVVTLGGFGTAAYLLLRGRS